MASRQKRKVSDQSKGKGKASSSSMVNPLLQYLTIEQEERYTKFFSSKNVQTPKYGILSTFPQECFSFQNTLASYGLEPVISSFGPYYPELVRMFFSNMHMENGKLISYVAGKRISLTFKLLGRILNIPSSGSSLYDPEDEAWADFNKRNFYYSIGRMTEQEFHAKRVKGLGGVEPSRGSWSAGIFYIDDRLFHYFMVYIMFPRAGNHCTVTELEMQLLYARKNNIEVNWARLIMAHMSKFNHKSKFLPYAWFITRILEHFEIDFDGYEVCLMNSNSNKITIKNVDARMGVLYNPATKTITYIGEDVVENEGNEQEVEGGEEDARPAHDSNGPSNQELYDFMTSQFANLNTSINNQWNSINESTTNRINEFRHDVNQQFSYLYSHLYIPPYDPTNPAAPPPRYTEPPIQQEFFNQGPFDFNNNNNMDQP